LTPRSMPRSRKSCRCDMEHFQEKCRAVFRGKCDQGKIV
jgi:hypothetical protein